MKQQSTSWNQSAQWYDEYLQDPETFQVKIILPNIVRLLNLKKGEVVFDAGCGQGFFTREFAKAGVRVIGVDSSEKLIQIAKHYTPPPSGTPLKRRLTNSPLGRGGREADGVGSIEYHIASADSMPFIKDESVDKIVSILALQNMDNLKKVFVEFSRVLKPSETAYLVLNHPAFRNPRKTSWGWDEENQIQYRRVDQYLSESKVKVQMHPGSAPSEITYSFHRSLQLYFKLLANSGFAVTRLEEWTSNRESERGPRKRAEDFARKEFPLFLFLEAQLQ